MDLDQDMDRDAGPSHAESSSSRSRDSQNLADISLELALLKCLPYARPIGKHRHFRMIALQSKIRDMTGVVLAFEEIWKKLEEYYSLEDLDDLASSSASYPSSPRSLSPLPRPARGYGHYLGPLYSEDDMDSFDLSSQQGRVREREVRGRHSSSESLSPAPELPTGFVNSDQGKKGRKKGRLSDLPDNERSRGNGTGSSRGRRANDESSRGRSRSNASETPSTMMSGHPPYSKSINNLKTKKKERRGSMTFSPHLDGSTDSSIYPLLYPYPIPPISSEFLGISYPGPSESRPKPRNSKASFSLPTSSRNGKRLSGNKSDLDDDSRVAYEYNRINPPAYLSGNSGSESADLINSRYFANEFSLPLFADRETISEWKENIASGPLKREASTITNHFMDTRKWNGLVYERAGRTTIEGTMDLALGRKEDEVATGAPDMTLEVKKEETYGVDGPDAISSIPLIEAGAADSSKDNGAANDSPIPIQPQEASGPVDQEEAAAEMDVDMQLLGEEGDSLEPIPDSRPPLSDATVVAELSKKSTIDIAPAEATPALPSALPAVVGSENVSGLDIQPLEIDPLSQVGSVNKDPGNMRLNQGHPTFDESEIEPNFDDDPKFMGTEFVATRPLIPSSANEVGPTSKNPDPARRISSGRHQLADLLNDETTKPLRPSASPVRMFAPVVRPPPPPSSMAFMLNSPNNGSGPGPSSGSPAPFSRTALGNMEIPAFRGAPSWPSPMPTSFFGRPHLSPQANINLHGRSITLQGFHLVPAMPNHPYPARFEYAGPPMQHVIRRPTEYPPRPASRSPTPPRMSTGPVEIQADMVMDKHPHRTMPIQMASPLLDDAQEDVTEADTEVETPATPPRPKRGYTRKKIAESAVEVTKPELMPSSSRSNSISSPERPSRPTKAQSRRGRGRSTGSSRTREGSSAKLSGQTTASIAPRLKSPAPTTTSNRPQPKQKRKLSVVNEIFRGQETSSKKVNTNKAPFSLNTTSSRNSLSGPELPASSRPTSGTGPLDHQAAESEDELLLGPEGHQDFDDHPPARKMSYNTLDPQSHSSDSPSRAKETNSKKKATAISTPIGLAKATRSNDAANGSTRRKTRNR